MDLLTSFVSVATITVGEGSLSAAIVGVLSIVLFVIVGAIAGPNLSKFDSEG